MPSLPIPDAEARAVSATLLELLQSRIAEAGGCLAFDDFMQAALYEPGLGYYSNGLMPFGEQGDFITAPESGSLFARCLARNIASVLQQVDAGDILELGAGSGALAVDLLGELDRLGVLPGKYYILERSAAMRGLQEERIANCVPGLKNRVHWLDQLPAQALSGVVFGNEVADALPVKRFRWHDGRVDEVGVACEQSELSLCQRPADEAAQAYVKRLASDNGWQDVYASEYCPSLPAWVGTLGACLKQGLLMLVDYGYGRAEYYHPQRSMGTMMCHYRHAAHDDPLRYPGLQDITAFVDFTAIAEAASDAGMRLEGFSSQAQFLIACGIDQLLSEVDPADTRRFLTLSNEAKRLILPGEMGDRFKVIGFSRGLAAPVKGFGARDLRSRL